MYAQEEWDGSVVIDAALFPGSDLFALRVKGIPCGMRPFWMAISPFANRRQYAANGEIVVALIHQEEATVKRFFLFADHIELRPENKAYPVLRYTFGEVLVQGKVVGLQRGPETVQ